MIRPAHILPIGRQKRYADMHMALTHLVESAGNEYNKFFMGLPDDDYIMLDNSVIELGEAVSLNRLINAAKIINADEIVIPDAYKNKDETLRLLYKYLEELEGKDLPYKIQVVPHGKNANEWMDCYNEVRRIDEVDVIGIPKVTTSIFPGGRAYLTTLLDRLGVATPNKEYHLLGVWNNPIELDYVSRYNWIRSVDSAITYACGVNGIRFDEQVGTQRPDDLEWSFYDDTSVNQHIIEHNIEMMGRWCQYE